MYDITNAKITYKALVPLVNKRDKWHKFQKPASLQKGSATRTVRNPTKLMGPPLMIGYVEIPHPANQSIEIAMGCLSELLEKSIATQGTQKNLKPKGQVKNAQARSWS